MITEREKYITTLDELLIESSITNSKEIEAVKTILTTLNGFTAQQTSCIIDCARTAQHMFGKTNIDIK